MKKEIAHKKEYFHISSTKNKVEIISEGIKSENKKIFVSDNEEQLALIAHSQIFLREYSVFKISSLGITGKIKADNVAEIGNGHQFIISQDLINPEHIIHLRDEKWNQWDLAEHCTRIKYEIMGFVDVESILELMVSYSNDWCLHYNKKYNKTVECITV